MKASEDERHQAEELRKRQILERQERDLLAQREAEAEREKEEYERHRAEVKDKLRLWKRGVSALTSTDLEAMLGIPDDDIVADTLAHLRSVVAIQPHDSEESVIIRRRNILRLGAPSFLCGVINRCFHKIPTIIPALECLTQLADVPQTKPPFKDVPRVMHQHSQFVDRLMKFLGNAVRIAIQLASPGESQNAEDITQKNGHLVAGYLVLTALLGMAKVKELRMKLVDKGAIGLLLHAVTSTHHDGSLRQLSLRVLCHMGEATSPVDIHQMAEAAATVMLRTDATDVTTRRDALLLLERVVLRPPNPQLRATATHAALACVSADGLISALIQPLVAIAHRVTEETILPPTDTTPEMYERAVASCGALSGLSAPHEPVADAAEGTTAADGSSVAAAVAPGTAASGVILAVPDGNKGTGTPTPGPGGRHSRRNSRAATPVEVPDNSFAAATTPLGIVQRIASHPLAIRGLLQIVHQASSTRDADRVTAALVLVARCVMHCSQSPAVVSSRSEVLAQLIQARIEVVAALDEGVSVDGQGGPSLVRQASTLGIKRGSGGPGMLVLPDAPYLRRSSVIGTPQDALHACDFILRYCREGDRRVSKVAR